MTALANFRVSSEAITRVGSGLQRPESVKTRRDGSIWTCDARGFVRIDPNGTQTILGDPDYKGFLAEHDLNVRLSRGRLPNGFTFAPNGDIVYAAYGERRFARITMQGTVSTFLDSVDGRSLERPNFVLRDKQDRYWLVVSTQVFDWAAVMGSAPENIFNGFVILVDSSGARIVADGLRFANECRLDAREEYFYISESFGRAVARFPVRQDGSLGSKEQFGPTFDGPIDGLAFDADDNLWVTQPVLERIVALTPREEQFVIADFPQPECLAAFAAKTAQGVFDMNAAAACASPELRIPTSIAFGGVDHRTAFVGSLVGDSVACFRSPVAGVPAVFW